MVIKKLPNGWYVRTEIADEPTPLTNLIYEASERLKTHGLNITEDGLVLDCSTGVCPEQFSYRQLSDFGLVFDNGKIEIKEEL